MRVPSPAASTIVRLERTVIEILSDAAESMGGGASGVMSCLPCYPRKRPEFKCDTLFLLMFPD
ncbi:hypothetical protein S23_35050 [Bradyrhizobium cosmicum]|uniref:Uncharacterized protein n=1 Tax=Bradyrhizobium cosmicum TaxID=1404864 RepID=A0AAI8QCR8_9BRAD|nr:hypothetical protein S23_35050 [Bradyrhizobium cosmicum]